MKPVVCEGLAGRRFGLGNFILMMHLYMINTATMDIKGFSKVLHAHRRALNVPTGKSNTPRGMPFHLAFGILGREFPQGKVGGIAFFTFCYPCTCSDAANIFACEFAVVLEMRGVKINAVSGAVGVAFFFQFLDEFYLNINMFGSTGHFLGGKDIERFEILKKYRLKFACDISLRFALARGLTFNLVLASVLIGS